MKPADCILFNSGVKGAEAEFGAVAESYGVEEINFTFEGHTIERKRGLRMLSSEELKQGDFSLAYVSRLMNRNYSNAPLFRKVLQGIWHIINSSGEVFMIGKIMEDDTVKGGTGWGAEFAKLCNKPLHVFDQDKGEWFRWMGSQWQPTEAIITQAHFAGIGTRFLADNGKQAIHDLYKRSFE